jgi:hypothetical protein
MGVIGGDIEQDERRRVGANLKDAEDEARDEVWASYRFSYLLDSENPSGMSVIDLGAGHASAVESLSGRVLTALKSGGKLNESVGASYIERNWPQSLKDSGAWPLIGLRQSFLNGSLTRLIDPDRVLKIKIPEFVQMGEFGLASGPTPSGGYDKVWLNELISPDEVLFDSQLFLLSRAIAATLKKGAPGGIEETPAKPQPPDLVLTGTEDQPPEPIPGKLSQLRISGNIPPEVWNRFGSRILPKLRSSRNLNLGIILSCEGMANEIGSLRSELRQALDDLGLRGEVRIE